MMNDYRDIDFEHAVEIAMKGHYGQTDHAGEPYMLHIFRVIEGVRKEGFVDNDHLSVAALHDLLEDTEWTMDRLRAAGVKNEVIAAVWALTHHASLSYSEYIGKVIKDEIAIIVKIADVKDHLARPNAKQFHKYKIYLTALSVLQSARFGEEYTAKLLKELKKLEVGHDDQNHEEHNLQR
jgi:hypothetical protein